MGVVFIQFATFAQTLVSPEVSPENILQRHVYLGGIGGFGSTTWQGLVPTEKNQNLAINMSTPIKVKEGGIVWGGVLGYEFVPSFALELNYLHYPHATVLFDSLSLFSFMHDNLTTFHTYTDMVSLQGKLMLLIPNSGARVYSSLGVADVHRKDLLMEQWRISPTFGAGINTYVSKHLLCEIGFNYTAGFGESQLNPTETYFPFLYSISYRLMYIF